MMMSKRTLIEAIANAKGCTRVEALEFIDAFQGIVAEQLMHGGNIQIHNLGTFKVKQRAGRKGRNPRTGEPIEIAARRVVTFRPSNNLMRLLNEPR